MPYAQPKRPEQIVVTMDKGLKDLIIARCRAERVPVARLMRVLLRYMIDVKIRDAADPHAVTAIRIPKHRWADLVDRAFDNGKVVQTPPTALR